MKLKTLSISELQKIDEVAQGVYAVPGEHTKQTDQETKKIIELMRQGNFDKISGKKDN